MKVIIGLGNPEKKYQLNRHNIGFMVLDRLVKDRQAHFVDEKKLHSLTAELTKPGEKIILLKPQTFMNNSGDAALKVKNFYKLSNLDLLIVHDEVDLKFGQIKLSQNSGSAGHRGVNSIIESVGKDLPRLRIGIDNREDRSLDPTDAYVMQDFTKEEEKQLQENIVPEAVKQIEDWLEAK